MYTAVCQRSLPVDEWLPLDGVPDLGEGVERGHVGPEGRVAGALAEATLGHAQEERRVHGVEAQQGGQQTHVRLRHHVTCGANAEAHP